MSETNYDAQLKSMNLKINRLEGEVDALRKEIEVLKRNGGTVKAAAVNKPAVHRPVYVPEEERVPALAKKAPEAMPVAAPVATPVAEIHTEAPVVKPVKEKTSMENKIGKNLMGIVASILVFAALIVFGGMIYAYIPDIAKVVIMYGISIAFAAFGIVKMKKDSKYKVLFSSIAGCGISAIYITSLISYFAFDILPMPVLVTIIVLWLIATGLLSKTKSKMFMYICNVGLIISTFLATGMWEAYYLAAILYVLGLTFIYLLNRSESYNKDCHVFIQLAVVASILVAANKENFIYAVVLYVIVTAIMFVREKLYEINVKNLATYLVATLLWVIFTIVFCSVCKEQTFIEDYCSFIFVAALSVYLIIYNKLHKDLSKALSLVVYYVWAASLLTLNIGFVKEYLSYSVIALVFIAVGIIKKKIHGIIPGYFYLLLFLAISPETLTRSVTSLIVMAFCVVLYIYNVKNYKIVYKFLNTALFILALSVYCVSAEFGALPSFIVFALVSLLMNTDLYAKNYSTGEIEKGIVIVGYVVNAIMMLIASYLICDYTKPFEIYGTEILGESFSLVIIVLFAIALFMVNTKRLFTVGLLPKELSAVYIGVKFTVLIFNVLNRLDTLSFVISLVLLVFAVLCIILGFKFKIKSVRLYGLILTLVTVAKIILSDIEYDSFIFRPLGLLAAGLLCFGISYIYSRLEKQNKIEEAKEAENNDNVDI